MATEWALPDPTRLTIRAAGCETAGWGETRSRTQTWCDTRTYGNRMRVTRHRRSGPHGTVRDHVVSRCAGTVHVVGRLV